ncbi:MAG: DUF4430 domain-containing protein [Candidatus Liptonbacteria bacterium]|nr:DUF4430 domain-containing protein [Candidatus Liptonbacteria bacterium]
MKKSFLVGGAVLLITIAGGTFLISSNLKPQKAETPLETFGLAVGSLSNLPNRGDVSKGVSAVTLSFTFPAEKKSFEISTDGQASLFDLISKTDLKLETKNFPPLGRMIVSVNGFKNGEGGKYWQYWVNGKYAEVGVSSYKPQPGDLIEWKFTKDKGQ